MHREISHSNPAFRQESNFFLYLFTGLIGLIIGIDVWPLLAGWFANQGISLPTWSREMGGYRIALCAAILGGARILYGSLESLFEGRLGADLALAIACVAAILIGEPLVAAELVFIGMLGECLESHTFARTQRAVQRIVEIFPRRAWVLRDGQEVRVLTSEIAVGERVVVKPGGKVPVDGIVLEGQSAVDQSALTGENLPVDKEPGSQILAGSLNQFGSLTIEARQVGQETIAGRVLELTAHAIEQKAPLQRTADRLARYFLPAVLSLAALTFLGALLGRWWTVRGEYSGLTSADWIRCVYPALAVLVVACPCPLILATPAAILAAIARLAGTGILLKGGAVLERLADVRGFAFDKTGTLTEGRLELGEIVCVSGIPQDEVLEAAAIAEQRSEHPLAHLLIGEANKRGLSILGVEEFVAHAGAGVSASAAGKRFVVGNPRLLEERGIALGEDTRRILDRLDAEGQTSLVVCRDGAILGVVGARDRFRSEATGVISDLRRLGIEKIAILTGDRRGPAESVGRQAGIDEIHAGLLPDQKAAFIEAWQKERPSAMVGDGINDAPSLARAHVGLAVAGTSSDLAAEAGDILLMGEPLRSLPLLIRLSRETVRIIRQNILVFAFGVNIGGVVFTAWLWPLLASAAWYEQSPIAAVIYHQLGSLAVLLNSMRLLWFEREGTQGRWRSVRNRLQLIDQWLEHAFDWHEASHWAFAHRRLLASVAGLILLVAYALSGVTALAPDEIAVVSRFGRPVADLGPGLHFRWPWPIEETRRLQPLRVRAVELGFRSTSQAGQPATASDWATSHAANGVIPLGDESIMVTGDGNLVEVQATVRYSVADVWAFLFQSRDPEQILRAVAEAALREAAADAPFPNLLTSDRRKIQDATLERIRALSERYGNLGIRVEGLALHDLHPPQEVVPAYHDVARAMQARERQINEAVSQALNKKRATQARAAQIVRQAKTGKHETISQADAGAHAFLAEQSARGSLSLSQDLNLVCKTLWDTWLRGPDGNPVSEYERRRETALAQQSTLTDFRLYWNALGKALTGREKIIIDAEHVPGKRHLLLFDPEQWRVPTPLLTPGQRASPPRSEPRPPFQEEANKGT